MRITFAAGALGAIALAAALGCGPATTVQPPASTPSDQSSTDACLFFHSTASLADTIVVALFDEVDPAHAPDWRNQSERLVFQQLYESVNLPPGGCDPGLLADARYSEDGRVASFKLRDDARFWDGTRVTSHDVARSLANAVEFVEGLDSITCPDSRTIEVYVAGAASLRASSIHRFDWGALVSPALAVTKPIAGTWPMGTGPYRVVDSGTRGRNLTIQPSFDSSKPVIQFVDARGIDARDTLDPAFRPRIDFMIIGDPNVAEYARNQDRFHTMVLEPSTAYFLFSITRARALETHDVPIVPDSLTGAIARDALRNSNAHSLHASVALRSGVLGECAPPVRGVLFSTVPTTRRVLYDVANPTARDLAERIVALATGDPLTSTDVAALRAAIPGLSTTPPSPVAVGVGAGELEASLATSVEFAYVVGLPLLRPERCFLPRELVRLAPWLGRGDAPLYLKTIPLVITRPYAIATRSGSGATFALYRFGSGNIRIVGTSRAEAQ